MESKIEYVGCYSLKINNISFADTLLYGRFTIKKNNLIINKDLKHINCSEFVDIY